VVHVGAAQTRESRLDPHPVLSRKRQLVDLLDADRRKAGDEGALVDAPSDGRRGLAGEVVPEHKRLHIDPLSPGQPNLPRRPAGRFPAQPPGGRRSGGHRERTSRAGHPEPRIRRGRLPLERHWHHIEVDCIGPGSGFVAEHDAGCADSGPGEVDPERVWVRAVVGVQH